MSTLQRQKIAACLKTPRENWIVLDTVESTNSYCKALALQGAPDGTVVLAEQQSAGRGRLGRSFQSKGGLGVYLSVLWRIPLPLQDLMALPALGAVAACRAVERVCGLLPQIKWPNDLVCRGQKLGGILTELVSDGSGGMAVIMGIGINVHHRRTDFEGEVAEIASSLELLCAAEVSRSALAAALMEELDILRCEALETPQHWLEEYRRRCLTVGKEVQIITGDERRCAMALDIDEMYGLVVRETDGTVQTVRAGEVSVRGLYGYAP